MYSYKSISGVNQRNFHLGNWEDDIWPNFVTPRTSSSNSLQYKGPETPYQYISEDGISSESQECEVEFISETLNSEVSFTSSPSLEGSIYETKNYTMPTDFSIFNPSQFSKEHNPVMTTPHLKMQTSSEKEKPNNRINFIPSENRTLKTIIKRKRKRTTFTTGQIEVLEKVFSKKPYVTRDERQKLVQQLQVKDKSIKVWFQNRRLKNKKVEDNYVPEINKQTIFERLDHVESEINERTDQFGYVTLDDKIMSDLVNVIDDYFAINASPIEIKTECDSSPIYEPISPVSNSDSCDENGTIWANSDE